MNHISLFSGIGGFDIAADWMGWTNVAHCEWNPFGQKVLKHYWPNAISYHDITKTDFTIHAGTIDILTGGFPCQPYSAAGKRKGKADDRHLWPEMLRAIREIRPRWVVGENVRGLTNWDGGLVFDEVQADLENEGYEVTPFLLPACAVNAPHRRDRIWFIAHHKGKRCRETRQSFAIQKERTSGISSKRTSTYADKQHGNLSGLRTGKAPQQPSSKIFRDTANTCNTGLQGREIYGSTGKGGPKSQKQSSGSLRPNWEKFPTKSPVCDGNDGISDRLDTTSIFEHTGKRQRPITFSRWRAETIKAAGNAIVPQVIFEIFKAIEQYENI